MSDRGEELPPDQWRRVKEVFSKALEREPAERAAFLDQACGTAEGDVKREVEALLAAHQKSDSFLNTPAAALASFTPDHNQLVEGQTLGPYRVLRTLGHGGMATVYLARDERHHRSVALKVLHPELAHALGPERFLREIEVAANLSHPHILPLHDSGEATGLLYYVMPYVEGESLRDRLRRETQLPVDQALQIAREVADALGYAHGQGVIHRDIKPENILLSAGHALVADFGIARVLGQAESAHLTESGMAIGTAAYMSPEQASAASHIDGRSDVYSLGCVVYEMLAGEPPYTGPSAQAVIAKRFSDPVPSVRRVRPSVPESVDQAVTRALAVVPADRPATAAEFARALQSSSTPTAPARVAVPTSRPQLSRRGLIAAGVTFVLGLGALLGVLWRRRTQIRSLDANVVAVAPFSVTSPDTALGYLREGMVDLLAAKLTGQGGPRAADPRSVVSAWRRTSGSAAGQLPREGALKIAERLGAGQLLVGNVVGAPGRITLNASVLTVPEGHTRAETSVEGPAESLAVLVDRLAARLLSLGAREGEQRLATLTSTSLTALRSYLDGQAMYRRGRYAESTIQFGRALDFDSSFALAALGLLASGVRTGEYEPTFRGESLAYAARERLNPRDFAYLRVLMGMSYTDTIPYSQLLQRSERFVSVSPDRPEAYATLGDVLFNYGEQIGIPRAHERARAAYGKALELDSTYAPAIENLLFIAARSGDTATVRRMGGLYRTIDSLAVAPEPILWRLAVALDDREALARVRAGYDTTNAMKLFTIGQLSQYDGVALEDAEQVHRVLLRRESRSAYREAVLAEIATLALNQGRPAAALMVRQQEEEMYSGNLWMIMDRVLDALYWDGDRVAGAAAAQKLEALAKAPSSDDTTRQLCSCGVEQWRLAHGEPGTTRRAIAELQTAQVPGEDVYWVMLSHGCAILLNALLAAANQRPDAGLHLTRLDSLMLTGPPYWGANQSWNLVVARLKEAQGDRAGALAATRRRLYDVAEPRFLSTYLREEGRLAALTGDRGGAIRAYQHYLTLRTDPEPTLRAQVEQVRTELAQLLNEPVQ